MRKIKISHLITFGLLLAFIILTVSFTSQASNHISKRALSPQDVWLIGKGPFFSDTIVERYQHVYSDFPLLELDGRISNATLIEGYENGRKYLKTSVRNDTLYLMMAFPRRESRQYELVGDTALVEERIAADTIPAIVDDDYPILATIGAGSLRSITLVSEGKIDIPVRPYGSNPGGETVYKPEAWEKYVLRLDELDVYLHDWATAQLFLESGNVNLHIANKIISAGRTFSNIIMVGEVDKLSVLHPQGTCAIMAKDLKTDSVIVHSNPAKGSFDRGMISVNCKNYLEARLLYDMDVNYKGDPNIIKTERDYGRVINHVF